MVAGVSVGCHALNMDTCEYNTQHDFYIFSSDTRGVVMCRIPFSPTVIIAYVNHTSSGAFLIVTRVVLVRFRCLAVLLRFELPTGPCEDPGRLA